MFVYFITADGDLLGITDSAGCVASVVVLRASRKRAGQRS